MFQDLKHVLLLTTGYTGANKTQNVDISVLRVNPLTAVAAYIRVFIFY